MRYGLADGRVMESFCPEAVWKAALLRPGHKVLVWYDPADPQDVLIHGGRGGRVVDSAFVAVGALFIFIGTALAALGH
jgi:hypothetical protein